MDASFVTQLGVAGVVVLILLYILKELWQDNKDLRKQMHDDQAAVLPALQAASEATKAAMTEIIKSRAIAEHEGR